MELRILPPFEADPLVAALTPAQVERDVAAFQGMLDARVEEAILHEFLAEHSYFFNGVIRLGGVCPLYSKVRLGSEFETDFACFDSGSVGPEWHLIEIESARHALFTSSGAPSAALGHAIAQARDWNVWVQRNRSYAQQLLPHIECPVFFVFLGRRSQLRDADLTRLRMLNRENRQWLEVHTLDWFCSAARSVLNLLDAQGGGRWGLPMKALSHRDLAGGLPEEAQQYLRAFFSGPTGRCYPHEFVQARLSARDTSQGEG